MNLQKQFPSLFWAFSRNGLSAFSFIFFWDEGSPSQSPRGWDGWQLLFSSNMDPFYSPCTFLRATLEIPASLYLSLDGCLSPASEQWAGGFCSCPSETLQDVGQQCDGRLHKVLIGDAQVSAMYFLRTIRKCGQRNDGTSHRLSKEIGWAEDKCQHVSARTSGLCSESFTAIWSCKFHQPTWTYIILCETYSIEISTVICCCYFFQVQQHQELQSQVLKVMPYTKSWAKSGKFN